MATTCDPESLVEKIRTGKINAVPKLSNITPHFVVLYSVGRHIQNILAILWNPGVARAI